MATTTNSGPDQSQELEPSSGSPMWVAEAQTLAPFSAAVPTPFLGTLHHKMTYIAYWLNLLCHDTSP